MVTSKTIYYSIPVWSQQISVNLISARNYRHKYGRFFWQCLSELERNERKSLDQLLHEQQISLREGLKYARQHVPYYRKLDCPPDDLSAWPILEKRTVLEHPDQFLSDEFARRDLLVLSTGGTTGSPLSVLTTKAFYQREIAHRWRHRAWAGIPLMSRGAVLGTPCPVPARQARPPFWRTDYIEKRLLCSIYHLAPQWLPVYVEKIVAYNPVYLQGFPSTLFALAQFCNERGIQSIRPRAVLSASETLYDFQRAAIERAFGSKVFNWYGNTEMTANIIECRAGNMHHRTDYGYMELLADGTMICTGLYRRAMPFIRYRVGDRASVKAGTCPCGCAFPLVEGIEGRSDEYIRTSDGRLIMDLDQFISATQHVREAQFVQDNIDEVVLRIVRDEGYGPRDEQAIWAEANNRFGNALRLKIEYLDKIERTPSGKFRFVVSHLSQSGETPDNALLPQNR